MWTRTQLKETAKLVLKKNYGAAILVALVLTIAAGSSSGVSSASNRQNINNKDADSIIYDIDEDNIMDFFTPNLSSAYATGLTVAAVILSFIGLAFSIFVGNPLEVGCRKFFVDDYDENPSLGEIGYAFNGQRYLNIVGAMFLKDLFIGLWTLLFIIPGIYKAYEYRMIPYLLGENPEMSFDEAKNISKGMMDGNKWDAFVLDLSFIGWILLSLCTCGILSLVYVNPYMFLTQAGLFRALSNKPAANLNMGNGYNPYAGPAGYGAAGPQGQPNNQTYGQNFDPMTGAPLNNGPQQYQQNFDPVTGAPLNGGAAPTQPNVEPKTSTQEDGSIFSNNNQ